MHNNTLPIDRLIFMAYYDNRNRNGFMQKII